MNKTLTSLVATLCVACSNPGADVESATVAEAPAAPAADKADEAKAPAGERLAITPANSKLEWVGAKVTDSHPGGFKDFTGEVVLVADDLSKSQVQLTVQTASLFADSPKLTKHLMSDDFFDVAKFPTVQFKSASITEKPAGENTHLVEGDLTLHGMTKRIRFPARIAVAEKVAANAEFSINRKDFGITYPGMPDNLIRDDVAVKLSLDLPRK